jgi:hypothetical protein
MKTVQKLTLRGAMPVVALSILLLGVRATNAAYPDVILADNPALYLRLEELPGATTAMDSSTNGLNGSYFFLLEPESPQLGLPGIATNSILFRTSGGQSGDIVIPYSTTINPSTDGTNGAPFSAECWLQPTTQPDDYKVAVASFGPYGTGIYANASGWNFYQSPGPASFWILNMKPVVFGQATTVPITLGQWYHLVATFDGTNAIFYINGVARGTYSASGYLANPSAEMHIGSGPNVGFGPFDGGVDEVAVYPGVLTAAQVLAHYQSGTNSFRELPTPPTISRQPASTTNFSGTTVTFTVNALGTQPLSYQWFRDSNPITGATNDTLSFVCAFPADDGAIFTVVVANAVGSVTSAMAELTVTTDLNILANPTPITRYVGSKAAFRVLANGALPITYQWYKDDIFNPIEGATNDTLWLNSLQTADNGATYLAEVKNPFTMAITSGGLLTVVPRPREVPIAGHARVVVADDPVAYWRLNEPDGNGGAADAVGSFDGAYVPTAGTFAYGAATGIPRETDGAIGVTGGAVVSIPYALELNPATGPWSAEAWVKPASLDPGHFRTVFSSMWNSDFGNHVFGWNVYQHVAGVWTLNIFNGGGSSTFVSDFVHNPLVPNSWYHMVITDDRTTMRFYVNGTLVGSAAHASTRFVPNGATGGGGPTVLGQRSDNAFDPFDGTIDDVAFYNKALSAQQIQAHYLSTVRIVSTWSGNALMLSWPFGTLQQADTVNGTYSNVDGATSPYPITPAGTQKFYRVRVE